MDYMDEISKRGKESRKPEEKIEDMVSACVDIVRQLDDDKFMTAMKEWFEKDLPLVLFDKFRDEMRAIIYELDEEEAYNIIFNFYTYLVDV